MPSFVSRRYIVPFVLITTLFFMWGFARSVLDVLNKHFQEALDISLSHSTMIQASTYVAYALMALPAGIIITRWGYRRGVVLGLLLFAAGAFLFIPGASATSFNLFLLALFIIGCGLAVLETAANPYAAELGDPSTAASRLNLAQSFNGLGCILGPVTVGGFLFAGEGGSVAVPYTVMGAIVLIMAVVFSRVDLPEINISGDTDTAEPNIGESIKALWANSNFRLGLLALFCYEIAEIAINSLFINYATSGDWLDKMTATTVLSFGALGLFMLARIAGSAVMSRIDARKVLSACAVMTVLGSLAVTAHLGTVSHIGVFVCYAFEAIMFPTIFAMTISGTGRHSKIASSFLMMTPLGGAVGAYLMGHVANMSDMSTAFLVPCAAYCVVLFYSLVNTRKKNLSSK
ncbi:MAG: sugar MFS transporter [Muribaculaceae bacterium]|nr:sugar MFS transporter [Muribaculaceae bacterium]